MGFLQGFEFVQDVVFAFLDEFGLKLAFGDLEQGDVEEIVVAGQSMLAQANQSNQGVLSLLG